MRMHAERETTMRSQFVHLTAHCLNHCFGSCPMFIVYGAMGAMAIGQIHSNCMHVAMRATFSYSFSCGVGGRAQHFVHKLIR